MALDIDSAIQVVQSRWGLVLWRTDEQGKGRPIFVVDLMGAWRSNKRGTKRHTGADREPSIVVNGENTLHSYISASVRVWDWCLSAQSISRSIASIISM
jgi:hypothetical protein